MSFARSAILLCAGAFFGLGCADTEERVILTPPLLSGARSMILAIESTASAGTIERAIAFSLRSVVEPQRFDAERTARITALLYDETLEAMELPEGELMRAEAGPFSRDLPVADGAFFLDVPESRGWMPTEQRTIDFKIAARSPCPVLSATNVPIETTVGAPRAAVALDDQSALVFYSEGGWWRVTKDGATHLFDRQDVYAAWSSPLGDIWIVTSTGALLRGDLDRGFTLTATVPAPVAKASIDGSKFPAPLELFIMIDDLQLLRFDGTTAKVISDRHEVGSAEVDVAWVAPNVAIASGQLERAILRYENGVVHDEEFQNIFNTETPSSLIHDEVLGSFIGSLNGFFYRRGERDSAWSLLGTLDEQPFGAGVEALSSWREGIAIGVGRSQVSFFFENSPACALQQFGTYHIKELLTVGDDLLIIPDQRAGDQPPYTMLWLSVVR